MAKRPIGGARGDSAGFDDLLLLLFDDLHGATPWKRFLLALCDRVGGHTATLVLRKPALGDRGDLFDVNTVRSVVEVYRTEAFDDDPFLDLAEGEACSLHDLVSHAKLLRTRYYNDLLRLDHVTDILAINISFADHYVGSLKIARRGDSAEFGILEKSLLMRLYPHIKIAMSIFEHARRQAIENNAYARVIDQLAFGVVILNERGDVVRVNEVATTLIEGSELLAVSGNRLRALRNDDRDQLDARVRAILAGQGSRDPLKLGGKIVERPLYLLLKPIEEAARTERGTMGVAIFLSSGRLERRVAIDACASLYSLSKAEVALLSELVDGASILSASFILRISEHTARAQLRSIFLKTDSHRQADLFRLVLTSLAIIA